MRSRSGVFIVNFERMTLNIVMVFLLLTLNI